LEKTKLTPADIESIRSQISEFKDKPIISIIMPVFNIAPKWLDAAI